MDCPCSLHEAERKEYDDNMSMSCKVAAHVHLTFLDVMSEVVLDSWIPTFIPDSTGFAVLSCPSNASEPGPWCVS